MQAKAMRREFSFQGLKLPDPDPKMSVEDVRGALAMQYPENWCGRSGDQWTGKQWGTR